MFESLLGSAEGYLSEALIEWAVARFYLFLLVLVRLSGLMILGPVFGTSLVPAQVRILLALSLALLVTPNLVGRADAGFLKLDRDRDGRLTAPEIPDHWSSEAFPADGLSPAQYRRMVTDVRPPESLATLAFIVAGELGLGLALGLSVATILSGLQLAGDMIDQQTGLAIGQIFNPGFEEMSGSVSSRLLFLLGTTLFVIAAPVGFHLRLLACLIDTFETLPPGQVFLAQSAVDTLSGLVHASLVFGFQIAAPVLAMLNLLALATGFLGHTVPQINILIIGFPLRIMAALLIFVLAFTAIGEAVLQGLETSLQAMRDVLLGTP